ncbi:DUF1102 family [Halapricum desulfuricans]|uniref:DUF1102 family n=1 Tax=Halapricum desulfuricans TaxID=2841257 RepID=A0A897NBV0_9EURY|nr:DUF1102 family [Halapricum desulfuricans]
METANDANGLLGIEPYPSGDLGENPSYTDDDGNGNGEYAEAVDGEIVLDFTETTGSDDEDTGLNENAKTNIENVLKITNNGTQDVYVTVKVTDTDDNTGTAAVGLSEFGVSGDPDVDFARLAGSYDGDKLPAGDSAGMGFYFFLDEDKSYEDIINDIDTITIVAAESKSALDRYRPD